MKKFLTTLALICLGNFTNAQTQVYYDYMETWNWAGYWWVGTNTNWYTDISVSSPTSAVILGEGNSTIEEDWYVLPNVTLDPNKMYLFRFRLAAQSISNPTHPAAGNDAGDYVDVQVSTDGGLTYTSEIRIRGYGNANWDYNINGTIYETLNGVNNIYTPTGGGDRTNTGDGYSEISLEIPFGTTDLAVDLYCRVGRPGEEWWIDNIELLEMAALPVELAKFEGINVNRKNILSFTTVSEQNSSYFLIKHSTNGEFDENSVIGYVEAAGNSQETINYEFIDRNYPNTINYYQLTQVDIDGHSKTYPSITIDNTPHRNLVKVVNTLGQEVNEGYKGIVIEVYDDGSTIKTLR